MQESKWKTIQSIININGSNSSSTNNKTATTSLEDHCTFCDRCFWTFSIQFFDSSDCSRSAIVNLLSLVLNCIFPYHLHNSMPLDW